MRRAALFIIGCGVLWGCGVERFEARPDAEGGAGAGAGAGGNAGAAPSAAGSAGSAALTAGEGGEGGELVGAVPSAGEAGAPTGAAGAELGGTGGSAVAGQGGSSGAGVAGAGGDSGHAGAGGMSGHAGAAGGSAAAGMAGAAAGGGGTVSFCEQGEAGDSSCPDYCARLPAELDVDCSGDCWSLKGSACDAAFCSGEPVQAYSFADGEVPNKDELILPRPHAEQHEYCGSTCANCDVAGPDTYYLPIQVSTNAYDIYVKLSSAAAPPGAESCVVQHVLGHAPGTDAQPVVLRLVLSPAAAEATWVRVEIHAAEWAGYSTCDPQPL